MAQTIGPEECDHENRIDNILCPECHFEYSVCPDCKTILEMECTFCGTKFQGEMEFEHDSMMESFDQTPINEFNFADYCGHETAKAKILTEIAKAA